MAERIDVPKLLEKMKREARAWSIRSAHPRLLKLAWTSYPQDGIGVAVALRTDFKPFYVTEGEIDARLSSLEIDPEMMARIRTAVRTYDPFREVVIYEQTEQGVIMGTFLVDRSTKAY